VFILDGLAELGEEALLAAGHELAELITTLNPSAEVSWRHLHGGAPAATSS
jgi:hypothetical protein